jgi:hypothetical protein
LDGQHPFRRGKIKVAKLGGVGFVGGLASLGREIEEI